MPQYFSFNPTQPIMCWKMRPNATHVHLCVALMGEDLLRYSNRIEPGDLRQCCTDVYLSNTQGEMTSQNLWPRDDRHFVGIT